MLGTISCLEQSSGPVRHDGVVNLEYSTKELGFCARGGRILAIREGQEVQINVPGETQSRSQYEAESSIEGNPGGVAKNLEIAASRDSDKGHPASLGSAYRKRCWRRDGHDDPGADGSSLLNHLH